MNTKKSLLIRLSTNIILLGLSLIGIIFLWNKTEGFNTFCMVLSFLIFYFMISFLIYGHTLTQKEKNEQQGDFMCDC